MPDKRTFSEARVALDDVLDAIHDLEDASDVDAFAETLGADVEDRLLGIVERAVETLDAFASAARRRRSEVVAEGEHADPDPASFGPFFVQFAADGMSWQTWTVANVRADAERVAETMRGARIVEARLTAGDASALLAGELGVEQLKLSDPPVGGPVSLRVVSLVELLLEPREELHQAISALLTSDYESKLRLGGDLGRTTAYTIARHEHTPSVEDVEKLTERLRLEAARHGRESLELVDLGLDLAETMPPIAIVRNHVDEVSAMLAGEERQVEDDD